MDRNLLAQFLVVAELASFSGAAQRLGVRRSSVSRAVAALERSLGVQLFSRSTRHVALTTAGQALYEKVKPHLTALDEALGNVREREQAPSGELRLTTTVDIGVVLLPRLLSGFLARYPKVSVDVRLANRVVDLVAEGIDAAIRVSAGRLKSSSLVARKLGDMDLQLCASPGYLAKAGTPRTPQEAAEEHEWVLFEGLKLPPPFVAPRRPRRVRGDDMLFVLEAVRSGLGMGVFPTFLAEPDLREGRLVRVLPKLSPRFASLHLVHPPAQHVPRKLTALRDYLLEQLALHPLAVR